MSFLFFWKRPALIQSEKRSRQNNNKNQPTTLLEYRGVVLIHVNDAVEFEPAVQHELALHVGVHARVVQHNETPVEAPGEEEVAGRGRGQEDDGRTRRTSSLSGKEGDGEKGGTGGDGGGICVHQAQSVRQKDVVYTEQQRQQQHRESPHITTHHSRDCVPVLALQLVWQQRAFADEHVPKRPLRRRFVLGRTATTATTSKVLLPRRHVAVSKGKQTVTADTIPED
jgi:hypothetical protein